MRPTSRKGQIVFRRVGASFDRLQDQISFDFKILERFIETRLVSCDLSVCAALDESDNNISKEGQGRRTNGDDQGTPSGSPLFCLFDPELTFS